VQPCINYFAYGSNLHPGRLEQRIGPCGISGVARLFAFELKFHKRGKDGSAKCDAFRTGDHQDCIYGVIYAVSTEQMLGLNEIEGLGNGYELETVQVELTQSGELVDAQVYVTQQSHIDTNLAPYSWYRDFVLFGARIQGLPVTYISQLQKTNVIPDPDSQRHHTNLNILSSTARRHTV